MVSAGSRLGPVNANLYHRLGTNEIRVLILNCGTWRSKPTCCLETRTLQMGVNPASSPTQYTALSYVWGSPANPRPITCDGSDFFVSRNLFDALVALQTASVEPTEVWIDAICINQADDVEKSQQIALMGAIYSRAFKAIIWLGRPGWLTGLGFLALNSLARELRTKLGDGWDTGHSATPRTNPIFAIAEMLGRALNLVPFTEAWRTIWKHLVILPILRNEYFRRIWTAQEFALSGDLVSLVCGGYCIDMSDFILGAQETVVMGSHTPTDWAIYNMFICRGLLAEPVRREYGDRDPAWSLARIAESYGAVGSRPDLLSLLNLFRCSAATDPVDKVFGLASLSNAVSGGGAYGVDDPSFYPKRAPGIEMNDPRRVKSTYVAVAKRILERQRSLRLLGSVRRCSGPDSASPWGLPSWVPDWSDTRKALYPRPFSGIGEAGEPLDVAASVGEISDTLVLHGALFQFGDGEVVVDRVVKVGAVCDSRSSYLEFSFSRAARLLRSFFYLEEFYRLDVVTGWAEHFLPDPAAPLWEFVLVATGGWAAVTGKTRRPAREMLTKHRVRGLASVPRQTWFHLFGFLAGFVYTAWGESIDNIKVILALAFISPVFLVILGHVGARILPGLGEPLEFEGAELRRMVQTASGRLVLAPEAAALGDVIALCRGGLVPLVLRPVGTEPDIHRVEDFELIGEAYVSGMMDSSRWEYNGARRIRLI